MPAMWDPGRLTNTNTITTATAPEFLPQLRPLQPRKTQQQPAKNERDNLPSSSARYHWGRSFDKGANALGIAHDPYRYPARQGVSGEISPPPDLETGHELPLREPPPRNPLRLRAHQHQHRHQLQNHHQSDPAWRPASSIYTDDDDGIGKDSDRRDYALSQRCPPVVAPLKMYGRPTLEQISPPSSPDVNVARDRHMADDVSPIDEEMDLSQQDLLRGPRPQQAPKPAAPSQQRSNIPTMRRERRKQGSSTAAMRDTRPKEKASMERSNYPDSRPDSRTEINRWDAPPGAPFVDSRSSTPDGSHLGLTTTITGPQVHRSGNNSSPSFGERVRQFGRPKPEPLDNRPPWNGASGRTALVQPVRDEPKVPPLQVPSKNNKRGGRKISAPFASTLSPISPSGSETSSGAASAMRKFLPSRSDQRTQAAKTPSPPVPVSTIRPAGAQSYPSPPHVESPIRAPHAPAETSRLSPAPLLTPETVPSATKAIKRKPPPAAHANIASHAPHPSTSSSVYSSFPDQAAPTGSAYAAHVASMKASPADDTWVQPSSRFSITTYATSNADSPRQSAEEDRPPMPTPPTQLTSMMDRRRPLPAGDSPQPASNDPVFISMKSAYVPALNKHNNPLTHLRGTDSVDSTHRPISIMSTSKALPPAPPELSSANDRVANLNARLENLAHRRNNINRSIKQMTELMPTDNLMASTEVLRKREIEKQKVEGLKQELAEVQQEEYDLGLKLHRAYKRLDKDREFEPTTLWVRRVTG